MVSATERETEIYVTFGRIVLLVEGQVCNGWSQNKVLKEDS